jgi:hypothetical protein
MPFVIADRVKETTVTTGTSTLTLAGAVTGFRSFSSGIGANNTTYYTIASATGAEWEVGLGTVGAGGTTLARTTILASSNAGSVVNLSAGTKEVFVTYPAGKSVIMDPTDIIDVANDAITKIKTATFNSQTTIATTTGAITVDWTTAQNQKQTEPTGTITYTFTAPPGPCHLQLLINSDGTSTAQTINWPGTVVWYGATYAGVNNKKAIVNFWYDGTNYNATYMTQV